MNVRKIPPLALIALLLLLSAVFLIQQNHRIAAAHNVAEVSKIGATLSEQMAFMAGPLMLSEDWVSLNVALKHTTENPYIAAADIINLRKEVVAQVGKPDGTLFQHPISSSNHTLGEVRLYLDGEQLLLDTSGRTTTLNWFIAASHLLILLGFYLILRQHLKANGSLSSNKISGQPIDIEKSVEDSAEENLATPMFTPSTDTLDNIELTSTSEQYATESDTIDLDNIDLDNIDLENTGLENAVMNSGSSDTDIESQIPPTLQPSSKESSPATDHYNAPASTPSIRYFVIFINCRQGSSHLLEETAREELLAIYQQLFERVCEIYRGAFGYDQQGNWLAQFPQQILQENEADLQMKLHCGSNALCAAQLFKSLYRKLNQQRIMQMKPVLNLKIGLVAGDLPEELKADAKVITTQTESNEIITSGPLYQFTELRNLLLEAGIVTRADNGCYLVHQLANDFQQLIDRQAEHFLQDRLD